jgi:hypothetical protein
MRFATESLAFRVCCLLAASGVCRCLAQEVPLNQRVQPTRSRSRLTPAILRMDADRERSAGTRGACVASYAVSVG